MLPVRREAVSEGHEGDVDGTHRVGEPPEPDGDGRLLPVRIPGELPLKQRDLPIPRRFEGGPGTDPRWDGPSGDRRPLARRVIQAAVVEVDPLEECLRR